jgi:hypothetical protein
MYTFIISYCPKEHNTTKMEVSVRAYTEAQALKGAKIEPAQVLGIRRVKSCSTKNC